MFKRETNLGECCVKTGFLEASFVRVRAWEGDFAKESGADAVGRHWDAYSRSILAELAGRVDREFPTFRFGLIRTLQERACAATEKLL